jgi:hypothetical protein
LLPALRFFEDGPEAHAERAVIEEDGIRPQIRPLKISSAPAVLKERIMLR